MHACMYICLLNALPEQENVEGANNSFWDWGFLDIFFTRLYLNVVEKIRSDAKCNRGYLIEFCVDDFRVFVPVVDVDPHL